MADEYVVAGLAAETLSSGTAAARVASLAAETLHTGNPATPARVTGYAIEVLRAVAVKANRRRVTLVVT